MKPLRLSRSVVGEREADAVSQVIIADGYLGMGSEVRRFENDLAAFLEVDPTHICCVSSGTAAIHLAVEALTEPGDEVLVQSLTFLATFQAISAAGAIPVACEVRPDSITIDLEDAERRLTPRTRVIMPVHYASNPADLDAVYAFAKQHRLRVIEDAAHAFGCRHNGRFVGTFGDVACFSFDGVKNITCGEGGAVVTEDPIVLARVADGRLLGVEKDTVQRYNGMRSWEFEVTRQGYRYHMSNVMAAIGRVQLQRFPNEFAPKRVALSRRYRTVLSSIPNIKCFETDLESVVPHIQPVRIMNGRRDYIREALNAEQIETGIHYKPNHLLALYGGGKMSLPVTEQLYSELLTLPLHPLLVDSDVDRVCDVIESAFVASTATPNSPPSYLP
jgi:dTDP-4-amino-4,6-dideoxygalactose transaminase